MELSPPKDVLQSLSGNTTFKDWKKQHHTVYLSHFFCPLTTEGNPKSGWEIGYFNPDNKKITIFQQEEADKFIIKAEDDVFKKPTDEVEELDMKKVALTFAEGFSLFKENLPVLFPAEKIGEGFVILQTLSKKTNWNFTYISTSIKFLNIKLNAQNGEVDSYQSINLIEK